MVGGGRGQDGWMVGQHLPGIAIVYGGKQEEWMVLRGWYLPGMNHSGLGEVGKRGWYEKMVSSRNDLQ